MNMKSIKLFSGAGSIKPFTDNDLRLYILYQCIFIVINQIAVISGMKGAVFAVKNYTTRTVINIAAITTPAFPYDRRTLSFKCNDLSIGCFPIIFKMVASADGVHFKRKIQTQAPPCHINIVSTVV